FVLMNCEGVQIKPIEQVKKLSPFDKWILSKLNSTVNEVTKFMDKYEVGLAAAKLYEFIWNQFCDWYIELSKTALYSDDEEKRSNTASVLVYVLREILKLVHPIIPFVTAEIYDALPNRDAEDIMIAPYPTVNRKFAYRKDVQTTETVMDVIKAIRNLRREMNVSQNKRTAIHIVANEDMVKTAKKVAGYIEKLAGGSGVHFDEPQGKNASLVTALGKIFIPMGDLIDFDKERERIQAEIAKMDDEIARAEGKLNNQGFVAKAPAALVEKEREKLNKYIELKNGLIQSLNNLN
ncbi:MAG: class I tRNA ligase family protein, partial [Clostridia bacterium]|nr:class I tRNA ligase family protein [Clostridia bacterium]